MIDTLATGYPIGELCAILEVSRSGYYAWRSGGRGTRDGENTVLEQHIRAIHRENRAVYGSPRITNELHARGIRCGHNRVARLMRKVGLHGVQRARFHPRTTDSRHDGPISPNRLDGMTVDEPNRVWVTDITYIATREGWRYLSAVMDLTSRTIKGWALRNSLKSSLVIDAFRVAATRYKPAPGLIVHSDRGCQYAGREFHQQLLEHHALSSMSRAGNCYDNAAMESFWATLKTELQRSNPFNTEEEARLAIFDYIETFYNRRRLHSALGYKSPLQFEAEFMNRNIAPAVSAILG